MLIRFLSTLPFLFLTTLALGQEAETAEALELLPVPSLESVLHNVEQATDRALVDEAMQMKIGVHAPWHVVHGLLAYGDKLLLTNPMNSEKVSALNWVRDGGRFRDMPIFFTDKFGVRGNQVGASFEGHMAQFGGYISELGLPLETTFMAYNPEEKKWGKHTLEQLYGNIKKLVSVKDPQNGDQESSWALWALARSGLVGVDDVWTNNDGDVVSLEKLVEIETFRDSQEAGCSGLHGLYAMSVALRLYKDSGKELTGTWLIADFLERKHIRQAHEQQNPDGSFSSAYFTGRGEGESWRESLPGSGHIFEWLMLVVPDKELQADWIVAGANSVAQNMLAAEITDMDIEEYILAYPDAGKMDPKEVEAMADRYTTLGSYFHAAHGLRTFQQRLAKMR